MCQKHNKQTNKQQQQVKMMCFTLRGKSDKHEDPVVPVHTSPFSEEICN